jgi:2-dehydropantoate 2-reductase
MQGGVRQVVVLDANREHVARLRDPGLLLDRLGELSRVRLDARASVEELDGHFDFALITLKAPALEAALPALAARGIVDTFVALGNGLVQDRIAAIVGRERLGAGTVEMGATNLGPGHLRQTTDNPFVIGELDGARRDRTRRLARILEPVAGVQVTDNIAGQLWSKLLVNTSLSGLGVVGGCTYGEVAADPDGREALFRLWSEGHGIGLEQDLRLEPVLGIDAAALASADPAVRDAALETVIGAAGATKASMLQDVERGLPTEVDVINGSVVNRAAELGAQAPFNAAVVAIVQRYERGEASPARTQFAEVAAARRPMAATREIDPRTTEIDPRTTEANPRTTEADPRTTETDPRTTETDPRTTEADPRPTR